MFFYGNNGKEPLEADIAMLLPFFKSLKRHGDKL
jgi:hypothetical protein